MDLGISYGVVSDHPDGSLLDRCNCGDPFSNPLADCFHKSWESRSQVKGFSLGNPQDTVRKRRNQQRGVRGKKEGFGTAVIPVKISRLNHILGVFFIPVCLSEKIIKSHLLVSHPLGIQGGVWI